MGRQPRDLYIDDQIKRNPKRPAYQRINEIVQAGTVAAVLSWLTVPALRVAAMHNPAMYALLPLCGLTLAVDAYFAVQHHQEVAEAKGRHVSKWIRVRTATAVSAAVVANLAVLGWVSTLLTPVSMLALPYLVVAAFGLRVLYHASSVMEAYADYRRMVHPADCVEKRKTLVAETAKLGCAVLGLVAAVGLLLVPMPVPVLIGLVGLAALMITAYGAWRAAPRSWRHYAAKHHPLFNYEEVEEEPDTNPDRLEFGLKA